jgi:hypothetical protein
MVGGQPKTPIVASTVYGYYALLAVAQTNHGFFFSFLSYAQ